MRARSDGEKRSPKAASKLLRATLRPCTSRYAASAPQIRESLTTDRRERRGMKALSVRTPFHSHSYRKDFQPDFILPPLSDEGILPDARVDLEGFNFTLAQAAARRVSHHGEIRPFRLYRQHLSQPNGLGTVPPSAWQSQGHRSGCSGSSRGARPAAKCACGRCLSEARDRHQRVPQPTADGNFGGSGNAHFRHDGLSFGNHSSPLSKKC